MKCNLLVPFQVTDDVNPLMAIERKIMLQKLYSLYFRHPQILKELLSHNYTFSIWFLHFHSKRPISRLLMHSNELEITICGRETNHSKLIEKAHLRWNWIKSNVKVFQFNDANGTSAGENEKSSKKKNEMIIAESAILHLG